MFHILVVDDDKNMRMYFEAIRRYKKDFTDQLKNKRKNFKNVDIISLK